MPGGRARLLAVAINLLCVGCPAPAPAPSPPGELVPSASASPAATTIDPTLRWAIDAPSTLVPIDATTPDELLLADALFDSLTAWDEQLVPRPAVADRWERDDSARTWRFWIDPEARFSNGRPVTAGHFVRTWSELARRGRAHHHLRDVRGYAAVRRGGAGVLRGVRARGRSTLVVRLVRPVSEFPSVVAHPSLAPMVTLRRDRAAREMPVGNGPFRMAEPWVRGSFVRLSRTGTRPSGGRGVAVQEVVFQITDPASAYIAFEQGGVDVATVPPIALTGRSPASPTTRYHGPGLLRGDLPSTYFLVCSNARQPCRSRSARKGLSLAVDRRRAVADAFYRSATPAGGVIPGAIGGPAGPNCRYCRHDPVRARRLLDRSGVERTRLWISKDGDHERVARAVAGDLARVGVTVKVKAVAFEAFTRALRSGKPGLFRFGWALDYPTGDNALRALFHSKGEANYSRYRHRDVDALLDAAARAPDARRRRALYQAAQDRIVGRDQAVVAVAALRRRTVVAERVRGLVYGPMGTANLTDVRIVEPIPEE